MGDTTAYYDFSMALSMLKVGKRMARLGWSGIGQTIGLQLRDAGSVNTLPYIYFITGHGDRVPWVASQTDLLSVDWYDAQE